MAQVDGGELLMRVLDGAGVRAIFTLHGGHLDAIYQAARERDVRLVDTLPGGVHGERLHQDVKSVSS